MQERGQDPSSSSLNTPASTANAPFSCIATAWQMHEGELRGYLRHRMADPDAADDMLQDVFVKAMRQGQGFCSLDNPRAWLFQVARNALVDRLRMTRPVEPLSEELAAPEPDRVAPVDELAECLARCMSELTAEDAEIVRSCDLEGQTARAYAQARGLGLAGCQVPPVARAPAAAGPTHPHLPGAVRAGRQRERPHSARRSSGTAAGARSRGAG